MASFSFTYDNILSLVGDNSIVGRALVLHQDMDDLGLGNNSMSLVTGELALCDGITMTDVMQATLERVLDGE